MKSTLVTGRAGYIGSHTCVKLLNSGYDVIVVDNFCNSSYNALKRVEQIAEKKIKFYEIDIRAEAALNEVFSNNQIEAVIHFAGLKAVGELVSIPLDYYDNNIGSTITLCKTMTRYKCKNIIFGSSATVYGEDNVTPLSENLPKGICTNPYGWIIEQILTDLHTSDNS